MLLNASRINDKIMCYDKVELIPNGSSINIVKVKGTYLKSNTATNQILLRGVIPL